MLSEQSQVMKMLNYNWNYGFLDLSHRLVV